MLTSSPKCVISGVVFIVRFSIFLRGNFRCVCGGFEVGIGRFVFLVVLECGVVVSFVGLDLIR